MKYTAVQAMVGSVVANLSLDIPVYPGGFFVSELPERFVRLSVVASGRGDNNRSCRGMLLLRVFTLRSDDPTLSLSYCDSLDRTFGTLYLKEGSKSLQMFGSSLSEMTPDRDDSSRMTRLLSIPFTFNEVL